MKFTKYVVTEVAGNSVDPLGWLRPSGEISGALFRQFTVLSNDPAYQGFLAFAYQYLSDRGITPAKRNFSRQFRDLEILWGVLSVRAGDSLLNVTKFEPLLHVPSLQCEQLRRRASLYSRLNYGVLGHYSSPSASWRILERDASALTELGTKLAAAWSSRSGRKFSHLADEWLANRDLFEIAALNEWMDAFKLSAEPESKERGAWRDIIDDWCRRDPIVAPLWNNRVSREILALSDSEQSYQGFFQRLPSITLETMNSVAVSSSVTSSSGSQVLCNLCSSGNTSGAWMKFEKSI